MSRDDSVRAWVDESGSDHTRDPGTYILAAAIGRRNHESATREQIARLRLPGQAKLHWSDESEGRRVVIADTVAACDLEHIVVVRSGHLSDKVERRRRKCLERLLFELEKMSITEVVAESRGRADDRRDMDLLNALRGRQVVTSPIRLTHSVGRDEPMLWIPDAVCGAITNYRTGNPNHREALQSRLTVIEVPPDS